MISTYVTTTGGVLLSWIAQLEPLAVLSTETAAGLGILAIISSLALGQRVWGRAQRRFWKDFDRITKMLEGDLKVGRNRNTAYQTAVLRCHSRFPCHGKTCIYR